MMVFFFQGHQGEFPFLHGTGQDKERRTGGLARVVFRLRIRRVETQRTRQIRKAGGGEGGVEGGGQVQPGQAQH